MLRVLVALIFCLAVSAQVQQFTAPTGNVFAPVAAKPNQVGFDSQPPEVVQTVPAVVVVPPANEIKTPPTEVKTPPTEIKTPPTEIKIPPQDDLVWLCDDKQVRRGSAGSPEAEKLIDQGIVLHDCHDPPAVQIKPTPKPTPKVPTPVVGQGNMCDARGRPRGRASSPYVRSLIRQGVQLQPCAGAAVGGPRVQPPANAGMMCDANGRTRGRASSPYVAALVRQGLQLRPCPANAGPVVRGGAIAMPALPNRGGAVANPVVPNRGGAVANPVVPNRGGAVANPVVPNRVANPLIGGIGGRALPIGGGAGMMCDANGRTRGRASSPYVAALVRQGMQLQPCPARAEGAADSTATASSSATTPSWAIALIVVGTILIVVLIVLVLRLTQILKSL